MTATSKQTAAEYREGLRSSRWFSQTPETLQEQLLTCAEVQWLSDGERLFSRGDEFDGIYCVVRGALRVSGSIASGKEALLAVVEPYNWLGEIALFDGLARTHDAISEGPSIILRVPPAALSEMLRQHPDYWRWFGLLVTQKMRFAFIGIEEAALLPAPLRVARRLVSIAEGYGELAGCSRRILPLPQEQLGAMLSLSRQTINQVLKQLEQKKLIRLNYRELEILDLSGLRQAGQEPHAS